MQLHVPSSPPGRVGKTTSMPMSATRTSPASGTGTEWQAFFEADAFQYAEASIDLGITILRLLHLVTLLEHIILLPQTRAQVPRTLWTHGYGDVQVSSTLAKFLPQLSGYRALLPHVAAAAAAASCCCCCCCRRRCRRCRRCCWCPRLDALTP